MKDYPHKETQELFNLRQEYLKNVTKEQFLENDDVWFYSRQIQAGTIPACSYVRSAVQRELDKLNDPDCPYYFDAEAGYRFFAFCRYNYHLKGPLGGQSFVLSDWQIWVFSMILGWKRKHGQNANFRQYKITYLECPRGSGKSAMMALFGLYMLALDHEWEPEIYVAATKKDQANLLFNSVIRQIEFPRNRKLYKKLKLERKRETIISKTAKAGSFRSLSKESKSFDGMNVHCALVDEIHALPNAEIWEVLKSGANKRPQSMMIGITTAGTNVNGFGYQQSNYFKKLLDGEYKDDNAFGAIWTVDKGDDLYNPETWIKANPSWFASINHDDFKSDIERTKNWPETRTEVYTKYLNVWYQSNDKWLPVDDVGLANKEILFEENYKDCYCIIGVDLAYAEDMLAYVNVYEKWNEESNKFHYYVFPHYYTPDDIINSGRKPKYIPWVKEGLLEALPGQIIDFDIIQNKLEEEWNSKHVLEFAFDRYNAHQMAGSLQNKFGDDACWYVTQSATGLNEASKFFKRLLLERRIHFHNDIFVWNCLNAVVKNYSGIIKIGKDEGQPSEKIDGLAACLNALERFLARSVSNNEISIEFI